MPTAPKAEVPNLQLPDWLPAAVREEVIKLQMGEFASHIGDEGQEILIRLACDERMKEVWKYFKRRGPVCAQPARFPDPRDPHSLEKIKSEPKASDTRLGQAEGQRQFFRHAFFYAANQVYGPSVMSRSNLNKRKASYAQAAEKLEALAETLRSLGHTNYADQLKAMAPDVREGWRELDDDFWIVERDRARSGQSGWPGATVLRRYIAELANFNCIVFGNVLYGTVATVANVAFDLKEQTSITGEQVRQILRAPPTPVL
ncbi:MAG TPA: hypothetical protein VH397_15585 [Xanthobacteraceae bacterium]|jgi:hypothetical protein